MTLAAGPLRIDPSATCTAFVEDPDEGVTECGQPSRFVVERSDGDTSFGAGGGTEETCEAHLVEAVIEMVAGYEKVTAVVTIRWDAEESTS